MLPISVNDLWYLFYADFVLDKNWSLDRSFFDDVYDSKILYSKLMRAEIFCGSDEVTFGEKNSCFRDLKKILKFPEIPNAVSFDHSGTSLSVPSNSSTPERSIINLDLTETSSSSSTKTISTEKNSKVTFSEVDSQNNLNLGDHIDVQPTPQPEVPEVPTPTKSFDLVFLKNGQANEIHPCHILNVKPNLSIFSDIDNYITDRIFETDEIDFSNFVWTKGEPNSVTTKLLADLESKAKALNAKFKLSIDLPETIDETICQVDYFLKKWSGEIASRLKFVFPYDIPLDICNVVAAKFKNSFPQVTFCWKLLMKKFPKYKLNYSCFEVMFGRRIHERFRNRAHTLRDNELYPPTMRSYKLVRNEIENKASLEKYDKSKKGTNSNANNTRGQLDVDGLPVDGESGNEAEDSDDEYPLEAYFDYNDAMQVTTRIIGTTEYTAPLIYILYMDKKHCNLAQAKEKRIKRKEAASAKRQLEELRKQTKTKKDQDVGLPLKKKKKVSRIRSSKK